MQKGEHFRDLEGMKKSAEGKEEKTFRFSIMRENNIFIEKLFLKPK